MEYIPKSQSKYRNMSEQPFPADLVQTDALARARAEQEKIVRELEANKGIFQSIKGQRNGRFQRRSFVRIAMAMA
jgi:hypothetical protein